MIESFCTYVGREEILVAYLYDDIPADTRTGFERHLIGCAVCRTELAGLSAVRTDLGTWMPPERAGRFISESPARPVARTSRVLTIARELPAWMQFAAAMVVLGASAGLANLNVSHGQDGWSVRTGWLRPAPAATVAAAATVDDIAAVERRLRAEVQSLNSAAIAAAASSAAPRVQAAAKRDDPDSSELVQQLRALVQQSERRQQRELALRLAEVVREVQMQRQADLMKIDRTLGVVQNSTGMAIRDQQQLLNNLAVRVSSQR